MKLGLQVPVFTYPGGPAMLGETFGQIAKNAEQAGFTSFWVMDHFFQIQMVGPKGMDMLEGYSALAYAAALTKNIKLGTMVTGVTYRYPGILIKTVTTLDVLSGGRAYLGICAAWNEEEHMGLGVPYPPLKERFELLEETLQLAHQMWSGEAKPFESAHLHLAETLNSPNALSKPHPPILIGGTGEQKTLRFVAKYGDACNIYDAGVDFITQKYNVLRERCQEEGRDYNEIEKTTLGIGLITADGKTPAGLPERIQARTSQQMIEHFHQLAELGTDHALVSLVNVHEPAAFEVWANEIVLAVAKFTPAGR